MRMEEKGINDRFEIIRLKDVAVEFEGKRVLEDVNLRINRGDFVAITGPNGGGKTTLMRVMLKLLVPTKGSVSYYLFSEEVNRLKIGYLPQKSMLDTRFPITVKKVVLSGLQEGFLGRMKDGYVEKFESAVETCGIRGYLNKRIGNLSGGELQRTLLARAIISEPEVLFLDEPLSYVDKKFEHKIYSIMEELRQRTTIILVSHEMSEIGRMADRHIIVDHHVDECHDCRHLQYLRESSYSNSKP